MTDRFKEALHWYVRYFTGIYGGYIPSLPHHDAVQQALTLASESEQLKAKLDKANKLINKVFKYDEYGSLHIAMADLEMIELLLNYKANAPEQR